MSDSLSLDLTFCLKREGGEQNLLYIGKLPPTLFGPHPVTNCHTIPSWLVSRGGDGSSWGFPTADQSKGYTIFGLLAKPQEGQPVPVLLTPGAGEGGGSCSASRGSIPGSNYWRGWTGGSFQSLPGHPPVPGSLLQPHSPDLRAPINVMGPRRTPTCKLVADRSFSENHSRSADPRTRQPPQLNTP